MDYVPGRPLDERELAVLTALLDNPRKALLALLPEDLERPDYVRRVDSANLNLREILVVAVHYGLLDGKRRPKTETGRILGINTTAVYQALYRAQRKLEEWPGNPEGER
jgi:hypothetical protein